MTDFTNIFPNAKQFDRMNALLAVIASKTGESKINSWYDVQQAVRMGVAPTLFPIGTQLVSERKKTLTVTGSITGAAVATDAFIKKVGEAHGVSYEFTYDGIAWHLHGEPVLLADYGITVTGIAAEGDKIVIQEITDKIIWDVVAHDYNVDPHGRYGHSMTLLTHDCAFNMLQYDAQEALYYCENGLTAGTYHFTVENQSWYPADNGKDYQFTLTRPVPVGGQLVLGDAFNQTFEGKCVKTYASVASAEVIETASLTEGSGGTPIVSPGSEKNMNYMHRALRGSGNWKESAIRQFLNSDAAAGSVWTPQTKFDRPPAWAPTQEGWMNGMDPQFLDVVGTARIVNHTNSVYEVDGNLFESYSTDDKFWLASTTEIFGGVESGLSDGKLFPYYEGATNVDRIKYNTRGRAGYWWLRSSSTANTNYVRYVNMDGSQASGNAQGVCDIAVACAIF